MGKPRTGHLLKALGVSAGLVWGCRPQVSPHAPALAAPAEYAPVPDTENAFDHYALAAKEVEQSDGSQLTEVSFYPGQKKDALAACRSAVAEILQGETLPCDFKFVPHPPFHVPPFQAGWRLLGHVMRWQIDEACQTGKWDAAIDGAISATHFGFDLTGGGPTDASLGLAIADDARIALLPFLSQMGATQLQRLADGITQDLKRKPQISAVIEHDAENIKLSEETLELAADRNDFDELDRNLGPDAKEAIDYVRSLHGNDSKLAEYFSGFAKEGATEIGYLEAAATVPAARRGDPPKLKGKDRPWKHFAHDFFVASAPLLPMDDRTVARTKLLILTCELLKAKKLSNSYPPSIAGFDPAVITDPYSGEPFRYRADATEFSLYSVGENLKDDGGDTDESFTTPDLKLELRP